MVKYNIQTLPKGKNKNQLLFLKPQKKTLLQWCLWSKALSPKTWDSLIHSTDLVCCWVSYNIQTASIAVYVNEAHTLITCKLLLKTPSSWITLQDSGTRTEFQVHWNEGLWKNLLPTQQQRGYVSLLGIFHACHSWNFICISVSHWNKFKFGSLLQIHIAAEITLSWPWETKVFSLAWCEKRYSPFWF